MPKSKRSRFDEFMEYMAEHSKGIKAYELAAHLGVVPSTVYRYAKKARIQLGVTVDDDRGTLRMRSEDRTRLERQGITLSPLEVALLLTHFESSQAHSPAVRRLLEKLRSTQGQRARRELGAVPPLYLPQRDALPDGLYDDVLRAILEGIPLEITYRNSEGKVNPHRIDPYILVPDASHLYVVAMIHSLREAGHSKPTSFRLDGVQTWTLLMERFTPPDFDPAGYWAGGFLTHRSDDAPVRVRLEVSSEKAHTLERTRRHPSQTSERLEGGGLLYGLEVPLTDRLVTWVLSYGRHLKVLEPAELRERVQEEARWVLEG